MNLMTTILPKIKAYLNQTPWDGVPVMRGRKFSVTALAQGEYNLNYLLHSESDAQRLVLRYNLGTQIDRSDQIVYEYKTLQLLEACGVTPRPYFVDDSRRRLQRGILIMDYLPGSPLDYHTDLVAAAELFGTVHQVEVPAERNHLIPEDAPLSLIFDECSHLLERYFTSDLAAADIRAYLLEVRAWAAQSRHKERYYQADPWPCIVNTEVNSGNFLVDRAHHRIYLVDWEMPRWGDPSQDLAHFCSPLTTLWKTDYRMPPAAKRCFLEAYKSRIRDHHLRDTLDERVRLRDPFVYLRGISWSAMGWVAYQTNFEGVRNPDTWQTLQRYMNLGFIRSLFDPFLTA